MSKIARLEVNGVMHEFSADPQTNLLEVLRNDLALTGSKYGCGEAQCGACTVLIDGFATRSCTTPVSQAIGKKVITIEGLESDGRMHPLQQAFLDDDAMQCGYCTPGMIMSAYSLLKENPNPTAAQIVQHMEGNVCRCCAYPRIVSAVARAAKEMRESK